MSQKGVSGAHQPRPPQEIPVLPLKKSSGRNAKIHSSEFTNFAEVAEEKDRSAPAVALEVESTAGKDDDPENPVESKPSTATDRKTINGSQQEPQVSENAPPGPKDDHKSVPIRKAMFVLSEGRSISLSASLPTEIDDRNDIEDKRGKSPSEDNERVENREEKAMGLSVPPADAVVVAVTVAAVIPQPERTFSGGIGGESDESDDEILRDLVPIPRDLSSAMGVIHEEKEDPEEGSGRDKVDEKRKFSNGIGAVSGDKQKTQLAANTAAAKAELELKKKKAKAEYEEQLYREEMREFRRKRKEILDRYPEEDAVEIPPQEGFTLPLTPLEKEKREQMRRKKEERGWEGGKGRYPEGQGKVVGKEEDEYQIIGGRRRRKVYDGNLGPSPAERARSINWMSHREPKVGKYISPMSPEWQWSDNAT